MPTVELEIPPGSAYVAVVRLAMSSLARAAGLSDDAVEDLKMALSEACANAVLANEERAPSEPVGVRWTEDPDRIVIQVADRGSVESASETLEDSQGFSSRYAMSVALLRTLVERCTFEPREGGGMTTTLVVPRPSPGA